MGKMCDAFLGPALQTLPQVISEQRIFGSEQSTCLSKIQRSHSGQSITPAQLLLVGHKFKKYSLQLGDIPSHCAVQQARPQPETDPLLPVDSLFHTPGVLHVYHFKTKKILNACPRNSCSDLQEARNLFVQRCRSCGQINTLYSNQ